MRDPQSPNYKRGERFYRLLLIYKQRHEGPGEDEQTILTDMFTDIRHWAEDYGVDIYKAVDDSYMHYCAEKAEEKPKKPEPIYTRRCNKRATKEFNRARCALVLNHAGAHRWEARAAIK